MNKSYRPLNICDLSVNFVDLRLSVWRSSQVDSLWQPTCALLENFCFAESL